LWYNNTTMPKNSKFDWQQVWEKHNWKIITACFGIFFLGIGVLTTTVLSLKKEQASIEIISSENEDEKKEQKEIFVDVSGAVQKPGLYKLPSNARINDALASSGGISADADREWFSKNINLAQIITDGTKIYIPFENEISKVSNVSEVSKGIIAGDYTGKISINNATLDQLDTLPGIGPSYAQRIIDARPFSSIEDLMEVSGIGQKTFDKLKSQISL